MQQRRRIRQLRRYGGEYQALVKNYYREAGIDLSILPGGPAAFGIQEIGAQT